MRLPSPALLFLALPLAACQDYEVTRSRVFDTFVQGDRSDPLDILWVLDDSSSTLEEQAQLATTSATFIEFLTIVEIPFQLGVVTTTYPEGEPDAGALRGGAILTEDSEAIVETFAALVLVEDDGSTDERGLDATVAAADPDGPNPDFARADADLEVIIFSDEDDHSRLEPEEAIEALEDARPGMKVSATAIIGDLPEGCATLLAAADPGFRYAELAELSQGLIESICVADYEAMLERIALHTLGLTDTFQLSRVPEVSSMEVRVNGALLYPRDRHGWRYDPGTNTVIFDGYAMPPPGAVVDVEYYEWYGPLFQEDTGTSE